MEVTNTPDTQSETASVKFNNFEIKLSRNSEQLTIDADNESTLKHFSVTITADNIKDLTRSLFRDIEIMYLDLLEAFEQKAPAGVTVSITDDARIIYSLEREVRGRKAIEDFTLWLDEEKVDKEKEQETRIEKLLKKIGQQESRIAAVEQEKKGLIERIQALEEENSGFRKLEENLTGRMQALEIKTQETLKITFADFERKINLVIPETEKLVQASLADFEKKIGKIQVSEETVTSKGFEFDTPMRYASSYSLSNGNKTITRLDNDKWGNPTVFCLTKQPFPKSQKTTFSVKIEYASKSAIVIGIGPDSLKTQDSVDKREFHYYNGAKGSVFANGKEILPAENCLPNGAVVTLTVDLVGNTISYEVDGVSKITTELDSYKVSIYDYYPYVNLYYKDDKVTII